MKLKRVAGALLAVALAVTSAGCGSKETGDDSVVGANKAAHFYKAEYMEDLPDTVVNLTKNCIVGDKFYYSSMGQEYDKPLVGCVDLVSGESTVIWEKSASDSRDITVNGLGADKDGNVYFLSNVTRLKDEVIAKYVDATEEDIINYLYNEWGLESYEAAEEYWQSMAPDFGDRPLAEIMAAFSADYENDFARENAISKYDASGNEIFSNNIELSVDVTVESLCVDGKGNILLAINEYTNDADKHYVMVIGEDGNPKGNIEVTTYLENLFTISDGRAAYAEMDENFNSTIIPLDTDNMAVASDTIPLNSAGFASGIVAMSDTEYLANNSDEVMRVDTTVGEAEKYFSWLDSNIMGSDVRTFGVLSDKRIAVFMENYGNTGSACEIALLHEISEEEANAVTPINVVCFYSSYEMRNAALDFNRKHSDYRITLTNYYDFMDESVEYEDAMDSFVTDCATDSAIDIIVCEGYSQMLDFADKGLLVDLNQFMAGDDKINSNTLIPAIYDACTYDGLLAGLPMRYSVRSLVGKSSVVGDRTGWTVKECIDAYKNTGAKELILYQNRSDMLNRLISLNYDEFIDLENATCNFNNQDFQDVLELSAQFPEEYQYDDESDEYDDFQSGKIMMIGVALPDFTESQQLASICGEKISFVGFPTSNGNGAMMQLSTIIGITNNCKNANVAWEYMRTLYLPNEESYGSDYYNGSILKTELDQFFEDAKNWTDRGEVGVNGHSVKLTTPTEEEINTMRDIIENASAVADAVPASIMNIISEEAAAYYNKEKTASDVAKIVQSRVDIYLSETR